MEGVSHRRLVHHVERTRGTCHDGTMLLLENAKVIKHVMIRSNVAKPQVQDQQVYRNSKSRSRLPSSFKQVGSLSILKQKQDAACSVSCQADAHGDKKRSICTQNAASCEGASTHDVRSLYSMSHPDGSNQFERSQLGMRASAKHGMVSLV